MFYSFSFSLHTEPEVSLTPVFYLFFFCVSAVKPKSPSVKNVTFNLDSNQAVIYIQTPYHSNYLKIENQLFQLHICTAGSEMVKKEKSDYC